MQTAYKNWSVETDNKHIITLTLNQPGTSINVLSQSVLNELQCILATVKNSKACALVFKSAKKHCFIAGADINEFSMFHNHPDPYKTALQAIEHGQQVMNSIAELPFPTFALINGFCLGGGMELALACDYRIALEHEKTRLGLPEIKLGIHPGFGGSVRANRLLGVFASMSLMLSGRTLSARSAKKSGLIDDVIPQRHFNQSISHYLDKIKLNNNSGWTKHQRPFYLSLLEMDFVRPVVAYILAKNIKKRIHEAHYPAPFRLINLWKKYAGNTDLMMRKEAESVALLINTNTAKNLIRVFHLQELLKSQSHETASDNNSRLQHIHIIGGGVMGGDIAIWCAYKGFRVTVHDRSHEVLAQLVQRANIFLNNKLKNKRLIQAVLDRLIPDIKNQGIIKAQLIIEAIIEDVNSKQQVFIEAEELAPPDCIFATNTSSIPLDDISYSLKQPERLIGIHFFNPVSKMPLIEVVSSDKTSLKAKQIANLLATKISKLPLPVTSTPGFLVNRVLMPYLLESIVLYSEGIPAAYIDNAAKIFGMPMGPIELADKVGLDICLSVASYLAVSQNIKIPEILKDKVKNNFLGIKSGQGFYQYKQGKIIKIKNNYSKLSLTQVSDRLMFRLFNEAVACLDERVVANDDLLDAGIIFGTGFAPFLGGPMHYIKQKGIEEMDHALADLSKNYGERFKPTLGWEHLMPEI